MSIFASQHRIEAQLLKTAVKPLDPAMPEASCTPRLPRYLSQSFFPPSGQFELSFYYLQLKESLNIHSFVYLVIHLTIHQVPGRQALGTERTKLRLSCINREVHRNHRSSVQSAV